MSKSRRTIFLFFRDYFADDTDKYVLIGGAACDIVFTSNDAIFRATKDLDV